MKSLNPFLLLSGVLIAVAIFSFKSEEPKKEYAIIHTLENFKKDAITVTINSESKSYSVESLYDFDKKINELINNMNVEGWKVISTNYAFSAGGGSRLIYLERTKQ